ncbi:uncharacterized protein KY384_001551 [Bacidia gigantensis]|uniref:uncharacterized protein n=1 Tax=Bacidia gigantensis TaxID=2732470 RepID=UPI001D046B28|nr:uncharacterized protein KY384_001551 [Bacidia gigantensis]KAG8533810.1 hypothetical protein KY384_001551 [Bacidia gigantensis]
MAISHLQEPEFLDLNLEVGLATPVGGEATSIRRPIIADAGRAQSTFDVLNTSLSNPGNDILRRTENTWQSTQTIPTIKRSASEDLLPRSSNPSELLSSSHDAPFSLNGSTTPPALSSVPKAALTERSTSPPPVTTHEAVVRAQALSDKLFDSNIPSRVTESGDLMLDMTGYKSKEEDALRAEIIARKILAQELEGNYDIGALIDSDEQGNLWIYSSEEAKEVATRKTGMRGLAAAPAISDAASDPGYHSDDDAIPSGSSTVNSHQRTQSDTGPRTAISPPETPPIGAANGEPNRNYAKTLRLTSDQLKALQLKPGANSISFSVNRATCQAHMYYWKYDVPIVISDIDGTITKSDALGHVLNMIGRDWTHLGVAKLYTDIVANGYHVLYLTSRSVGQADTTRAYLNGVIQEGFNLPKGPVIMSPDRTMAALRREIYLRKPEVFKMACLRDIRNLFVQNHSPFYAGFGNRLTDALSYRSVNIPSTRIFTINSNAEVSLDLLTLNKYKSSYVTMREVVDHFFPPVGLLVTGGGDEFTDFNYWRESPKELEDFPDSDSEVFLPQAQEKESIRSEDERSEDYDEDQMEELGRSYLSNDNILQLEDDGSVVESMQESLILHKQVTEDDLRKTAGHAQDIAE